MIVAVTGLAREARIAAGPGIIVVAGVGNAIRLSGKLSRALTTNTRGVMSFGIAGGLEPSLKPGDCVVASEVIGNGERFVSDAAWMERIQARLPYAKCAVVAGVDAIATSKASKIALFRATGAWAVDMESHIAAKAAKARKIPFAAVRVIADSATSELPHAASVAIGQNGEVKLGAVLGSVIVRPWQFPALLRTARDSKVAFSALLRCRHALGLGLAGPDVGEPSLDMR
jgi:hopanoid-associated phosphorylase